jgi:riboflavin kinase/FMN adenylyltransferase
MMKVFRGFEEAAGIKNPVLTTGSFDGVHLGHKKILDRLNMLAGKYDGESVLITFEPHPRKVLYPDTSGRDLKLISTEEEKLQLLEEAGLDNVIIVEFTREFSKITSEQFVRDYLCGILKAKVIVVGFNHHFGFNKMGDYRQLWQLREKYNFEAEEIPEQEVQHETVSSSKIRQAIMEGSIQRANAYLDHYYTIIGEANLTDRCKSYLSVPVREFIIHDRSKLLPAQGIYAVSLKEGNDISRGMVIALKNNLDDCILLHSFGKENFAGNRVTVYFHKKISGAGDGCGNSASEALLRSAIEEITELIY